MNEYLARFANYLSPAVRRDSSRHPYEKLIGQVAVIAYCLLGNHLHLVINDITGSGMSRLMHRVQNSYVRYFNLKYGRRGPLFDARFAAKPIQTADHARSTIAYVHLNEPFKQLDYPFSSHAIYAGARSSDWLDHQAGLAIFGGYDHYREYLNRTGPSIVEQKVKARGLDPAKHPYRPA